MNHWPALQKWTDMNYLVAAAGSRTVPVELGTSYAGSDWSQQLMSLRDFVTQHVTHCSDGRAGYLAQHQLFDQVQYRYRPLLPPHILNAWCNQIDWQCPLIKLNIFKNTVVF